MAATPEFRFTGHLQPGLFDSFWFMVCLTAVSAYRPPVGCSVSRTNPVHWRFIKPLLSVALFRKHAISVYLFLDFIAIRMVSNFYMYSIYPHNSGLTP